MRATKEKAAAGLRPLRIASALVTLSLLTFTHVHAGNLFREAEMLEGQKKYAEAADRYVEFVADQPQSGMIPVALMAAAWGRIHSGDPGRAVGLLDRIEESGAHMRMLDLYFYTRGVALHAAGQPGKSVKEFQKLAEGFPQSPLRLDGDMLMAEGLMALRRYREAIPVLNRLAESGYAPLDVVKSRYTAYLRLREYTQALADANILLTLLPASESEELLFEKTGLEERLGYDFSDALGAYLDRFPAGKYAGRAHRKLADISSDGFQRWVELRAAVEKGDREPYATENQLLFAEANFNLGDTPKAVAGWKNLILRNTVSDEARIALSRLNGLPTAPLLQDEAFLATLRKAVEERRAELIDVGMLSELEDVIERAEEVGRALRDAKAAIDVTAIGITDEALIARARDALGYSSVLRKLGPFRVLVEPLRPSRSRYEDYLRPLPSLLRREIERDSRFTLAFERDRLLFAVGEARQVDIVVSFEPALTDQGLNLEVLIRYPNTGAAFLARFELSRSPGLEEFESILPEIIARIR